MKATRQRYYSLAFFFCDVLRILTARPVIAQDPEVRALMKEMNADDGLSKMQITLYTSRWQVPESARLPPFPPSAHAARPAAALSRRYTHRQAREKADASACCVLS